MNLTSLELFKFLIIVASFLALAHSFAYLFEWIKLPRVIGEIGVGIIFGNTVLKNLDPEIFNFLFVSSTSSVKSIAGLQELGLIFLMFCSGLELEWLTKREDLKLSFTLTLFGLLIPASLGLLGFELFDFKTLSGEKGDFVSVKIIFILAVAVTSIPVISRILMDLGLLGTKFSRVILTVALVEDLILYGLLSALLAKYTSVISSPYSFKGFLGIEHGSLTDFFYNFGLTLIFFGFGFRFGSKIFLTIMHTRINFLRKGNITAFVIVFLYAFVVISLFIGIAPIFGALIAGMILMKEKALLKENLDLIRNFSYATFIPLYFVCVGFRIDLVDGMDWAMLAKFLLFSSVLKIGSILLGSKICKHSWKNSFAYGISLNARGGPGIVLATLAFNAELISSYFFGTLVITAILTSLLAGYYLGIVKEDIKSI